MSYFEGFITAVPTAKKDQYIQHANQGSAMMKEYGVSRMVENWADDVPEGKLTDFRRAVQARPDEAVVFSWFEYADKTARDAANEKMMADPRMEEMANTMPFDGKRMIYAGFQTLIEEKTDSTAGYTDGMVTPVPNDKKQAYVELARKSAKKFLGHGAVRVVEAWGDDVRDGKVTDFKRAVKAEPGETVVFSFIQWPDKATRDAAWQKMMEDADMRMQAMPFDGKRMFWGGFTPIVDA